METNIKTGDIVRLTDPASNGKVVRIESVDEHGFAHWLGGFQVGDMEQINVDDMDEMSYHYANLSGLVRDIENKTGVKLYPESAVGYWKRCAEAEEKEHAYFEQAYNNEHNKLLDAQDQLDRYKDALKTANNQSELKHEIIENLRAENEELSESLADEKKRHTKFRNLCGELTAKCGELKSEKMFFEDKTPITEEWLHKQGWAMASWEWQYVGDDFVMKIITTRDQEFCFVEVKNRVYNQCSLNTLGQLRQFLTLCGLGDFARKLK